MLTASELRDRLVTVLTRDHLGDRRRWRMAVGKVRVYSTDTHAHCNWSVTPSGSAEDIDRIETLVDRFREEFPIIR